MEHASSPTFTQGDEIVHPERFDPNRASGKLIDSEHRGRYWWASRLVAGKKVLDAGCGVGYGIEILASAGAISVTGVDIDASAVEEARGRFGERAETIVQGDLRDMRFDEDSFDLVVCFETIEHMENAEQALAEFRRVLRSDGMLLVSSPNPNVYPEGNEHHVHEYRPEELVDAVGKHFSSVASYRQHTWLASVIESSTNGASHSAAEQRKACEVWRTSSLEAGRETFGIIVAGEEKLPTLDGIAVLGSAFEVDWWSRQVMKARGAAERVAEEGRRNVQVAEEDARGEIAAIEANAREAVLAAETEARSQISELERKAQEELLALESNAAQTVAQATAKEAATAERLRETAAALLDANQELAQIPLLKHRLAELHEEHAQLWGRYTEIEGSRSWRLTDPLRRLWLVLDRRR